MVRSIIETVLEDRIGLCADSIGEETIEKAVVKRMKSCQVQLRSDYLNLVTTSDAELEALIESVVIPETWFFRNRESFSFLGNYIRYEWMPGPKRNVLRVLSLPCSTGEEPYSIAMVFLDSGMSVDQFTIHGVDISSRALEKAKSGVFSRSSFRGSDLGYRKRYFEEVGHNRDERLLYRIKPIVKNRVTFRKGNMINDRELIDGTTYDIVFCRNLLIYFTDSAKKQGLGIIDRMLAPGGILFVGHVERPVVNVNTTENQFFWIRQPGVFACRKLEKIPEKQVRVSEKLSGKKTGKNKEVSPLSREQPGETQIPSSSGPQISAGVSSSVESGLVSQAHTQAGEEGMSNLLEEAKQLANEGNLVEALEMCEACLKQNVFQIEAYYLMGLICNALDNEELAETYFNKTIYLDPNHVDALSHLAFIKEHRGDNQMAGKLRERAKRVIERKKQVS